MIVLGIDPGIGTTGWATIEENKGAFSLVSSVSITTPKNLPTFKRINLLYQQINQLLKANHPDVAALETIFFKTNVTTAFSVGQARGVVILALTQLDIPIIEYNPIEVKVALTGYGKAEKGQLARMVRNILKLKKTLTPDDVSDAAAIALCHFFSYKLAKSKVKSCAVAKAAMARRRQKSKVAS